MAQDYKTYVEELIKSSKTVHRGMRAREEDGAMHRWQKKQPKEDLLLFSMETLENASLAGPGTLEPSSEIPFSGRPCLKLSCPTAAAEVARSHRSYNQSTVSFDCGNRDFSPYNRLAFWIYPDSPTVRNVWISISLNNNGDQGKYNVETHFTNVHSCTWTQIIWEIPYLTRDSVASINISHNNHGSQADMDDTMVLYYAELRLQEVEADHAEGWNLDDRIAFCHSGYRPADEKIALSGGGDYQEFSIIDVLSNKTVFTGPVQTITSEEGSFIKMDFSSLSESGTYAIRAGDKTTKPFYITENPFVPAIWKTINFFYQERCGFDIPEIHLPCHLDVFSVHPDGRKVPVAGGWHDAGDLSQGQCNTSEAVLSFLDLAASIGDKDPVLRDRLMEEARWGLTWMLRTRFGDGYRAVWNVIGIWTKNIIGDSDDLTDRAYREPFENFCGAAAEAAGAAMFKDDPIFASYCLRCAEEDFGFAMDTLRNPDKADMRNSPIIAEVVLYGEGAYAAARLYELTGKEEYLAAAAELAGVVLACQQADYPQWPGQREDLKLRGFFYQDRNHIMPISYDHRSHEQAPVVALALLCQCAPGHKDYEAWHRALSLYGEYIQAIAKLISPYGLLPAALYLHGKEGNKHFPAGSIGGRFRDDEGPYNAQVEKGIKVADNFYLRRFPVSFGIMNGFHGVLLTKTKAVSAAAKVLKNEELKKIAKRQLEWVFGKNPFAQSSMYGEGYDFQPLFSEFAHDMVGELPVGFRTKGPNDAPFWPMTNFATFKEVWVNPSSRLLWTLSDL